MERMVRLYGAPTEYLALSVREALASAGLPCVLQCNEMPQQPGCNFGASWTYAEVFINPEDATQAREVLADVLGTLCAEDRGAERVYPRRINLQGLRGVGAVWLAIFLMPLFNYHAAQDFEFERLQGFGASGAFYVLLVYVLLFALLALLLGVLLRANRATALRTLHALGPALLGVLVLPFILLLYELPLWCWHTVIALGRWVWRQVNYWSGA